MKVRKLRERFQFIHRDETNLYINNSLQFWKGDIRHKPYEQIIGL